MKKKLVIKLSGRVFDFYDDKITKYANFISHLSNDYQPIIIAGGGKMARIYISNARSVNANESTLDEFGIEVSRLNAKLLICALKKVYPYPPKNLREVQLAVNTNMIVVSGGLYPGQSTNGTAALIAEKIGAFLFLNATDVDGIYDHDPNKNKNAKKFDQININKLQHMITHHESNAGEYDLMDLISLKIIERSKIKTIVLNSNMHELEKAVSGNVVGTEIIF
ncbi:MAG: UMP kinase [Thaumarchaeota archaeon]|nr:UMP kinase [Nitrososphaerota archaeon]MCY3975961.1 UMP kinase [Nitrososphaerota archaeon]